MTTKDRQPTFSCSEEWLEAQGWSVDLPEEEQARIEHECLGGYAAARALLWDRHYASLDSAERELLDKEEHPSCSWDRAAEAEPYRDALRAQLETTGLIETVQLGYYHGHTTVLTVVLSREMNWREYRPQIPEFFRGFQVFVVPPDYLEAPDPKE